MISDDVNHYDFEAKPRTRGRPRSLCSACTGLGMVSVRGGAPGQRCSTCGGSGLRPRLENGRLSRARPGAKRGNPGKKPDERRVPIPIIRLRAALLETLASRAGEAGLAVSLYCARVLERHLSQVK